MSVLEKLFSKKDLDDIFYPSPSEFVHESVLPIEVVREQVTQDRNVGDPKIDEIEVACSEMTEEMNRMIPKETAGESSNSESMMEDNIHEEEHPTQVIPVELEVRRCSNRTTKPTI